MNRRILLKTLALVACLLCTMGAEGAEAYACYDPDEVTLTFYYDNYRSSRTCETFDMNTGTDTPDWLAYAEEIELVDFDPSFARYYPTTTAGWFLAMKNLWQITGLEYLNTDDVTTMTCMFYYCSSLWSLDLSHFNTYQVRDMSSMFYACSGLRTIYVGVRWNTDQVQSSTAMFYYCSRLVGEKGTTYNMSNTDKAYAHIDGGSSNPGYLTTGVEAYAVYTTSPTKVTTFYYDNQRRNRSGMVFDMNVAQEQPEWIRIGNASTKVVIDPSFANYHPTNTFCWFNMPDLQTFEGLNYLNTSLVTDMGGMFQYCRALTSVDLSSFNTTNVTNMGGMFNQCEALTRLDLTHFNTSNVINMAGMFSQCTALSNLDVSSFNTANVISMNSMFSGCSALTDLDLSCFNTSNVGTMDLMFSGCRGLTDLDLRNFNTSNVTSMNSMFSRCSGLTSLDLSGFNTSSVTNMAGMFSECAGLGSLNLSSFGTSNVTNMAGMFFECAGLGSLNLSSFNTSSVTNMAGMFYDCGDLTTISVGNGWSTAAVTESGDMFTGCTSIRGEQGTTYDANHVDKAYAHIDGGTSNPGYLSRPAEAYAVYTSSNRTLTFYCDAMRSSRPGTTYDLNTGSNAPDWFTDGTRSSVTTVVFNPSFAAARPTTTRQWFSGMLYLQSIAGMEYLNTSEVTDMSHMFQSCTSLTTVDVSHFNTAKVTNMGYLFSSCPALTNVDISGFNTSQVTDMTYMFDGCIVLESIDLGNFNTSQVTKMIRMFGYCTNLTTLDLHSFNTAAVREFFGMFIGCSNLTTIYVGRGWSTASAVSYADMFLNCTKLVGGMGTTYDANHVDKAYAHIDGGPSNPGYFSAVSEAYAVYTWNNGMMTFYYDKLRDTRQGYVLDLNTGGNLPAWCNDSINGFVTDVVFDPSFADARPTSTCSWFSKMDILQSITGMNYLNTSEVTNMSHMFNMCWSLTSIDVSGFNTAKVTDMGGMFQSCRGLTTLDLRGFNTAHVTNMAQMFQDCSNLTTIYVGSGWSTAAVTQSGGMFSGCTSIMGDQGTTYDANHVDKSYAHIDGGSSNPGYLSTLVGPYAVYTSSNTTLTFYYDDQRSSRPGTTYGLNTGNNQPDWFTDGTRSSVTTVVFDPSFAAALPTTTSFWFYAMINLRSVVGIEYLNTSEVTDMSHMFQSCMQLANLDVSHFNTSKVTDMSYLFSGCSTLSSLDLSGFNTSRVTVMTYLCDGCTGLESLDVSTFNTSQVTKMGRMFGYCRKLTTLDVHSFNTAAVRTFYGMFLGCNDLTTIYAGPDWTTVSATDYRDMFLYSTNLVGDKGTTFDPDHVDGDYAHIDGGPSNPGYLSEYKEAYVRYTLSDSTLTFFYDGQRNIRPGTIFDLNTGSNSPAWYSVREKISKVEFDSSFADFCPTTTYCWFRSMYHLTSIIGISNLNTSQVTNMYAMFDYCNSLTSLDLSGFNTSNVTRMDYMFRSCSSLTSLDLRSFNTGNVQNFFSMFRDCSNMTTIYADGGWSTAACINSSQMFSGCTSLVGSKGTTYDPSHTTAEYAHIDGGPSNPGYLSDCVETYAVYTSSNKKLTFYHDGQRYSREGTNYNLNTGNQQPDWRTDGISPSATQVVFDPSFADARPTTTYGWFDGMLNLVSVTGIEYLNTDSVTNMAYMFRNCRKMTDFDLSRFNTSNVTDMTFMFGNCRAVTNFDLSSFNTDNVINMECMFFYCMGLTSVDLSSFTNARVSRTCNMFEGCSALTTVYASSNWYLPANNYSYAMFFGCTNLVGGMGTTWDENHTDDEYARIDGGPGNPGYFTEKFNWSHGDVNGDGNVGIADVTALIDLLLEGGDWPAVADVNEDGDFGIADVTALIDYLLLGTW